LSRAPSSSAPPGGGPSSRGPSSSAPPGGGPSSRAPSSSAPPGGGPSSRGPSSPLAEVLRSARCIVCVGPGGVGKTSTSGALGLASAHAGLRTCVLTIDPARRLANALGLPEIGNRETIITEEAFRAVDVPRPSAALSAMMLDIKEAWDDVIQRYHPDPERGRQIGANRMYQALSTALAGSQEYMAMEKLYQLAGRSEDRLDRIILDTPPAHHAVDFLDAPHRIIDALSNDATRWLIEPFRRERGRSWGAAIFVRTVSKLTGTELLEQLAAMLEGFQAMFDGFQARAKAVRALLESDETTFVVVGSPRPDGLDEARAFVERLRERHARVGAVILNRAHLALELPSDGPPELEAAVRHAGGTETLARTLVKQARAEARRAEIEHQAADALSKDLAIPVAVVPELPTDVHDLAGLNALRGHLVPGGAAPPRSAPRQDAGARLHPAES